MKCCCAPMSNKTPSHANRVMNQSGNGLNQLDVILKIFLKTKMAT